MPPTRSRTGTSRPGPRPNEPRCRRSSAVGVAPDRVAGAVLSGSKDRRQIVRGSTGRLVNAFLGSAVDACRALLSDARSDLTGRGR